MKNYCWNGGIIFVCILSYIDLCSCGDLCYDSTHEKYNYCSGYCCGDQCCNVDVGGIVAVVVAITIGIAAIIGFAICICYVLAKKSRVKSGWRTTVIHPRNLDDSLHQTTTVSYTTTQYPSCHSQYQNGVFTFALPSNFNLTRECPPLSPITPPSVSPIHSSMSLSKPPSVSPVHSPLSPITPDTVSPIHPPPYVDRSDSPPKYLSD
ncbi:uncharacterized protein LOC110461795 [Mizuhopecten yessoensis]|uniref:Cysteine and tyrosine-rich protein 1 n=1 Tax=Mizuhopecten yessoensis TaxID=6573 RepID=A0A210PZJ7_MIZYE|nr:uncharacterized protein LOC110461795 [Mizuhopecten yessoensis]OWF41921.1 hypothetical protein KP79_PYT11103 [Mizuhopecten yessoensis]